MEKVSKVVLSEVKEGGLRENHPPRHVRLGCNEFAGPKSDPAYHEVKKEIPILDQKGNVISSEFVTQNVPIAESLGKYKLDDFKLENLVRAGVPLNEMSVNTYNSLREEVLISKAKAAGVLLDSFQPQPQSESQSEFQSVNPDVEPVKD